MSDIQTYLTAYCSISTGGIYKDGGLLWKRIGNADGESTDFLDAAYSHFQIDYPKFYKMDHLSKLGFLGVELLLAERKIAEEYHPEEAGIVLSNANASLDADLHYFESVKNIPSPAQFVYTLPNIVIGEVSIRHGCKGENAFFVNESFDADFMWFYVQDLFNRKRLKVCISGWVDYTEDNFKAFVYLVEQVSGNVALPFNKENIIKIYRNS